MALIYQMLSYIYCLNLLVRRFLAVGLGDMSVGDMSSLLLLVGEDGVWVHAARSMHRRCLKINLKICFYQLSTQQQQVTTPSNRNTT